MNDKHVWPSVVVRVLALMQISIFMVGCAAQEAVTRMILPERTPFQDVTGIEEMKIRADKKLEAMRATKQDLVNRFAKDGTASPDCPTAAISTVDAIISDAEAKRAGLEIVLPSANLTPYRNDYGSISLAADKVKDIATRCGLWAIPVGVQPAPTRRNPGLLMLTGTTAGLGIAGLAAGGVLGGLAIDKEAELAAACPNNRCSLDYKGVADTADNLATASTIAFIAGGSVLALSGVPLIVYYSPRTSNTQQSTLFSIKGSF